jgi:hypothetical protein
MRFAYAGPACLCCSHALASPLRLDAGGLTPAKYELMARVQRDVGPPEEPADSDGWDLCDIDDGSLGFTPIHTEGWHLSWMITMHLAQPDTLPEGDSQLVQRNLAEAAARMLAMHVAGESHEEQ